MSDSLRVVESSCDCGTPRRRFRHCCAAIRGSGGIWIYGCTQCDDYCPECGNETPLRNRTDHLCTLDEVMYRLQQIRTIHGGKVGVMISFDGPDGREACIPYLPVNEVAKDDDDPASIVAVLCVSPGNHPFGHVIRMRPPEFEWRSGAE